LLLKMTIVKIDVTHSDLPGQTWAELRFDSATTISAVKQKLSMQTGSNPDDMVLSLIPDGSEDKDIAALRSLSSGGKNLNELSDGSKTLESYGVTTGRSIHVTDTNPHSITKCIAEADVHHIKMSDEEYNKRSGTVREFLRGLKKDRPDLFDKNGAEKTDSANFIPDGLALAEAVQAAKQKLPIGSRCRVKDYAGARGTVQYVGAKGIDKPKTRDNTIWVGIRLDEPMGNCGGKAYDGQLLFECLKSEKEGLVVPSGMVEVGDFPPVDPFEQDEM